METKFTTEECINGGLIVCLGDKKSFSAQRIQIADVKLAKIIAAAPDMLEALIWVAEEYHGTLAGEVAMRAIKKATE